MKVTRTMREFIEDKIRNKAEESLAELKKRADAASEEYDKEAKIVQERCKELTAALVAKYNIPDNRGNVRCYLPSNNDLPECIAYYEARTKAYSKVPRIVTEIAATMELGGTKAELLEMINNVQF